MDDISLFQKILPDILDVPPPPSITPPLINSDKLVTLSVAVILCQVLDMIIVINN